MKTDGTGTQPPPLTEDQLKNLVFAAMEDGDNFGNPETYHARYGHLERGLQIDDVLHGLERDWEFGRPPVFNKNFWQWKYYIETESIDGKPMTVILAVDTADRSFEVITRWN